MPTMPFQKRQTNVMASSLPSGEDDGFSTIGPASPAPGAWANRLSPAPRALRAGQCALRACGRAGWQYSTARPMRARDAGEHDEEQQAQVIPEGRRPVDDGARRVAGIDVALEPRAGRVARHHVGHGRIAVRTGKEVVAVGGVLAVADLVAVDDIGPRRLVAVDDPARDHFAGRGRPRAGLVGAVQRPGRHEIADAAADDHEDPEKRDDEHGGAAARLARPVVLEMDLMRGILSFRRALRRRKRSIGRTGDCGAVSYGSRPRLIASSTRSRSRVVGSTGRMSA